jgi:hypothetical protein
VEFGVEGGLQFPALPSSSANRALYRKVEKLARELNVNVSPVTNGESSVFNFVSVAAPALDGFGPGCGQDGRGDHYILKSTLAERATLLSLAAHRMLGAS